MKWDWKQFAIAALLRAVRTFAQSFVSMIAVGATFSEVQWLRALSVAGVAFVLSILTSLATGLPEVKEQPEDLSKYMDCMNYNGDDQPCPPPPKGVDE